LLSHVDEQARPHFGAVAGQLLRGALADGHDAVFAAVAFPESQRAALGVDVADFQAGEFGAADAGGVKDFNHDEFTHSSFLSRQLFSFHAK